MADPNWNWLDPRAWLFTACGIVGMALAVVVLVPLAVIGWLFEACGWIKGR